MYAVDNIGATDMTYLLPIKTFGATKHDAKAPCFVAQERDNLKVDKALHG